ncbi:MAG: thiopurine S-methyltransferase [Wenzhouxiangellaceae bacterium]|nr:thiopurine S-methyltransferase [Wenzhouxiangellaceae bacterium]
MDTDFWHERWQRNQIGFHRDRPHPALDRFWPQLAGDSQSPVLVPLCGKSLDMHWLAQHGHPVTGIEVDESAVAAFFEEAGLEPDRIVQDGLVIWHEGLYTIVQGDFFNFRPTRPFEWVYDRAALIALPAGLRTQYLDRLAALLAPDARGLVITLEYPQQCMDGPPFAVLPEELQGYAKTLEFSALDRRDVAADHPGFMQRGLTWLNEAVYELKRV